MRYKLVIAEKPSVAQSLAAVIGATARKDGYLEGNGCLLYTSKDRGQHSQSSCDPSQAASLPDQ